MKPKVPGARPSLADYQALAKFRLALRVFLHAADENAQAEGLTPQQHQALLTIKGGYPGAQAISITQLADHLLIKNHSAVELVGRLVKAGLATRAPAPEDRRTVCVSLTRKAERALDRLTSANLLELDRTTAEIFLTLGELTEYFSDQGRGRSGGAAED